MLHSCCLSLICCKPTVQCWHCYRESLNHSLNLLVCPQFKWQTDKCSYGHCYAKLMLCHYSNKSIYYYHRVYITIIKKLYDSKSQNFRVNFYFSSLCCGGSSNPKSCLLLRNCLCVYSCNLFVILVGNKCRITPSTLIQYVCALNGNRDICNIHLGQIG